MDARFLLNNLNKPATLIPAIIKEWKGYFEAKAFREYEPLFHKVHNRAHRKDKLISVPDPTGAVDPNTGAPIMVKDVVRVTRIAVPIQRLIVKRAVAFLTGGGVSLVSKPKSEGETELLQAVQDTWDDNKLDFTNSEIARRFFSETECAEVWYSRKNDDGTFPLKCNIYSPSDGYDLYPVFDESGDMIAFSIQYEATDENGVRSKRMDVYTKDLRTRYYKAPGRWGAWELLPPSEDAPNPTPLKYGKIPVIYYGTDRSIWQDVQSLIDRLETVLSNFCDTNDYNGSPILFAKGQIRGFAAKGETGKVIESEGPDADLKYVTWAQVPEAIKFEVETLLNLIFTQTQTPDISFQSLKGLGALSGAALTRIMIDAYLAAAERQSGFYGKCIQRRINFLIAACAVINRDVPQAAAKTLRISPQFNPFRINDETESIDNMMKANGGKPILSHKESIQKSGLTNDAEATLEAIMQEAEQQARESEAQTSPDA